jgi:hypothetical protein
MITDKDLQNRQEHSPHEGGELVMRLRALGYTVLAVKFDPRRGYVAQVEGIEGFRLVSDLVERAEGRL